MIKGFADDLINEIPDMIDRVSVMQIDYEYCKSCPKKLEAIRDALSEGYLRTITGFGKDRHYLYLPPADPEGTGTLTYLDESQQELIEALTIKKQLFEDISKIYDKLALISISFNIYIPIKEYAKELAKVIENSALVIITRRKLSQDKIRHSRTKKALKTYYS
ncbi:MAG TPA: hypothetical protein DCK81_04320 [Clostridiales bacterium UBA9856]|nr:hypothetical protein [Clostridiales bacterium UBA9856]HPZ58927.1 hypothetical protein [Bacillota bacterium]